ncbi:phosphatidylinositol-glycan biosynthesis class F protein-like [Capsicum annuum]|uniref:phosphatidylinositol-glycan biosynthesis class F protein-like n=1 Tax=Capsicum annuum TaxID=4072 RepID=UPI001FB06AD7|nr:phosphatidylinositol-glycan biosynthesis class F protein-like [Capsicum annuum]
MAVPESYPRNNQTHHHSLHWSQTLKLHGFRIHIVLSVMLVWQYLPAVCVFGSSWTDWHKIFARTKANESTDYMISLPTHGVVSGVWFGAWPMALDWESPWQVCYLIAKDSKFTI